MTAVFTPATADQAISGPTADAASADRLGRTIHLLAGTGLILGAGLFLAGGLTSPPQASDSAADYIASLARDPMRSAISAILFHYANIAVGMAVLAAPFLLRGRRGMRLVLPGALLTAVGFLNTSGEILADWWNIAVGNLLPSATAVEVFTAARSGHLMWMWKGTELFVLIGLIMVLVGLSRAGVLRLWSLLPLLIGVGGLFTPIPVTWLTAIALPLAFSPVVLIGLRHLGRWKLPRTTPAS